MEPLWSGWKLCLCFQAHGWFTILLTESSEILAVLPTNQKGVIIDIWAHGVILNTRFYYICFKTVIPLIPWVRSCKPPSVAFPRMGWRLFGPSCLGWYPLNQAVQRVGGLGREAAAWVGIDSICSYRLNSSVETRETLCNIQSIFRESLNWLMHVTFHHHWSLLALWKTSVSYEKE